MHAGVFRNYETEEPILEIYSDADWAADRQTRRSVSGSTVFFGGCLLYSSSRTQKIVSLSSAESETYAAASATMDAILIASILSWILRCQLMMCLYLDSSAARGILARKGVGRLRHLSCRVLWLQDLVMQKRLLVKAIMGALNPADIATKRLSAARLESLCYFLGIWKGNSNSLEGSHDPGNIFRHIPGQQRPHVHSQAQINLLISALGLLTQLQGCAAMDSNYVLDFGTAFVMTWLIGLVGYIYVFFRSEKAVESFGYVTELAPTGASTEDPVNVDSDAETEVSEYPPWSPEGMVQWLYDRCQRRMNKAVLAHDSERTQRYLSRQQILSDLLAFLESADEEGIEDTQQMLNDISDLSTDEASPTMNTGGRRRALRAGATGSTAAFLLGVTASQLQGCQGHGAHSEGAE